MKGLDFRPAKSKEEFRGNYKLHDLAERTGKNLLVQWGLIPKCLARTNVTKTLGKGRR